MAHLISTPRLELNVQLELNHAEVAALEALASYSTDDFLNTFYETMGKSYLQPHEKGLRSLFKSIREELPVILQRFNSARDVLSGRCESK